MLRSALASLARFCIWLVFTPFLLVGRMAWAYTKQLFSPVAFMVVLAWLLAAVAFLCQYSKTAAYLVPLTWWCFSGAFDLTFGVPLRYALEYFVGWDNVKAVVDAVGDFLSARFTTSFVASFIRNLRRSVAGEVRWAWLWLTGGLLTE